MFRIIESGIIPAAVFVFVHKDFFDRYSAVNVLSRLVYQMDIVGNGIQPAISCAAILNGAGAASVSRKIYHKVFNLRVCSSFIECGMKCSIGICFHGQIRMRRLSVLEQK